MSRDNELFGDAFTPNAVENAEEIVSSLEEQEAFKVNFAEAIKNLIKPVMESSGAKIAEQGHQFDIEESSSSQALSISITIRIKDEKYSELLQPPFLSFVADLNICKVTTGGCIYIPSWGSSRTALPLGLLDPGQVKASDIEGKLDALMNQVKELEGQEQPDMIEFQIAELKRMERKKEMLPNK